MICPPTTRLVQALMNVVFFLNKLVYLHNAGDPQAEAMLATRALWFIPCLNPDAYVANEKDRPRGGGMVRKNRRVSGPRACEDETQARPTHPTTAITTGTAAGAGAGARAAAAAGAAAAAAGQRGDGPPVLTV